MRIVFMGTPDFAVPALETICENGWEVPLVVTKEDRPEGRGHRMRMCAVKQRALELGLKVASPLSLKNDEALHAELRAAAADFFVVAAYGRILPAALLDIPAFGCVNIHGSLLPKYRGAAPIQRAVLAGDAVSGVTIMRMVQECDAGDILAKREASIEGKTSEQVFEELSALGAQLLAETLPAVLSGDIKGVPQDESQATYAPMIRKEEAEIDWRRSAAELQAHVLGMYGWPVAFTRLGGEVLRVHRAQAFGESSREAPGTVVRTDETGIYVSCGAGGVLALRSVQLPGRRASDAGAFLRGRRIENGAILG